MWWGGGVAATCYIKNVDAPRSFMADVRVHVESAGWRVVTEPGGHDVTIWMAIDDDESKQAYTFGPYTAQGTQQPKVSIWIGSDGTIPADWKRTVDTLLGNRQPGDGPRLRASGDGTSATCYIKNVDAPRRFMADVRAHVEGAGWRVITKEGPHDVRVWMAVEEDASKQAYTYGPYTPQGTQQPKVSIWLAADRTIPADWKDAVDKLLTTRGPQPALRQRSTATTTGDTATGTQPAMWAAAKKSAANEVPTKKPAPDRARAAEVPPPIFVSYSRNDQGYVDELVGHLRKAGLSCWTDKAGIDYGTRWTQVIRDAIDRCSVFVIVMTPAAEDSVWVEREIQRAEKKGKPILPLLLKGEEFFRLGVSQFEDVRGGKMPGSGWVQRVRRLAKQR